MGRATDKRKSEARSWRVRQRAAQQPLSVRAAVRAAEAGEIDLSLLRLDMGTQSRAALNADTVQDYAEAMQNGATFPAIVVFYDGTLYALADGFHRVAAAQRIGRKTLTVDVRQGTVRDAVLYSVSSEANGRHGLPRSRADVERAILRLLTDDEWGAWSDRAIARKVGCSPTTVGTKRASLSNLDSERTYINKHGQTTVMNTAAIGAAARAGTPSDGWRAGMTVRWTKEGHRPVEGRIMYVSQGWLTIRDIEADRLIDCEGFEYLSLCEDAADVPSQAAAPAFQSPLATAPTAIREAYDAGRMGEWEALRVVAAVQAVPPAVREVALRLCPHDSDKVRILADLYKSQKSATSGGTFEEIARTGGFHYGDDMQHWIDFAQDQKRFVYLALQDLSKQHRRLAAQAMQQQRIEAAQTPAPAGKYRCLVMDPPWDIQFVDRASRPAQGRYPGYATMSLDEIAALPVPDLAHEDGCHLYLWTTHKYLPAALNLIQGWGFAYECPMTWVKPTGMPPHSWMYNTEHVLFARRGGLPLMQMGMKLSFEAPSQGHSIKPDVFYERVVQASPGPRLDMFARQAREGFSSWGFESPQPESEVADAAHSL